MKRYLSLLLAVLLMAGLVPAHESAYASTALDNWTQRASGSSDIIYGVAYGNGVFVAGGDRIVTSTDGETWSTVASPPGFSFLASVSYGGGLFIGVGWSGNLFTSPDGTTWTARTSGTASVLRDAVFGDNLYVVVGDGGYILTSPDGETWTSRNSNTSYALNRITYGNGRYVAVGSYGAIVTSTDGMNWSSSTSGTTNQLYGATYGKGIFVVAGYEELILTSTDGTTWTERQRIPSDNPFFPTAGMYYRAFFGNGLFIVSGQSGKLASSTDGINWTSANTGLWDTFWGIGYGQGYYFLTAGQGKILQAEALTNAEAPSISTEPADQTVNVGDTSPALSVVATVSDGGERSYQWYSSTADSNSGGTLIDDATSATYAAPTASAGTTYYYVVVTNTNNSVSGVKTAATTSSAAKVTVNALVNAEAPSIGTEPADQTVNVGDTSPALSVVATVSDGGERSYQWYSSTADSNSGGTLIDDATSATYAAPTASAGTTYYYVVVTNTNNSVSGVKTAATTSSAAKVTVNALVNAEAPSIGTEPADQTVNVGDTSPALSVVATVSDGGERSYQWYSSTADSNSGGTLLDEATSATYAVPTTSAGTAYYYVVVTNTNNSVSGVKTATITSRAAKVSVNALVNAEAPSINVQPANQTANIGATGPVLSVVATVSDGGELSYQWYSSAANSNSGGTLLDNVTSATYAAPTTSAGTAYYYVVVTNTNNSVSGVKTATITSRAAKVSVNALVNAEAPSINVQPANQTANIGATGPVLSVVATVSDGGELSYQWYSSAANSNSGGTLLDNVTSATYAAPTTSAGTTYYYAVVTNTNNSVSGVKTATATSSAAKVIVNELVNAEAPGISVQPADQTVNVGDTSPTLSVVATVSDGGELSYQWYSSAANSNGGGTLIDGATSAAYAAPTTNAGTTYYYAVVTNTNNSVSGETTATATSIAAKVTVNVTVSFDSNGGSTVSSQSLSLNGLVTRPTDPTKTGYTFSGWYSDTGLTSAFDFSTPLTVNTTLYAKWTTQSTRKSDRSGKSSSTQSDTTSATNGKLTLPVGKAGDVSLDGEITVQIPAGASTKELEMTIQKWADTQDLLTSKDRLLSAVFEISKNLPENLSKDISLILTFNPDAVQDGQRPGVFYYDASTQAWVEVAGAVVKDDTISVNVNHFTPYAVFAVDENGTTAEGTQQTVRLTDIAGHWAESSIDQAAIAGIVNGFPDGTFKPDAVVTREEFAVMLMNALKPEGDGVQLTFSDNGEIGAWARKALEQAVEAGIINGFEDNMLHPDGQITRTEMAVMIARALGQSTQASVATGFSDDSQIPGWAKGAVAAMKELGVLKGKEADAFAPDDHLTRAEAVAVLLRMLAFQDR
ncbi:S-layer homology domain-containing protein [Paenibacillus sp. y28]|uniref:S-layer homology domain-containing protein n=1 Tax=Paenibacillus sp. y28 TaxID=3129110 RepID=UPI0030194867